MKHKFYYYEYSDDGGVTWTIGDYRRYFMEIVKLVRELSYRFRICNQDDVEMDHQEIQEALEQIKLMDSIFEKEEQI
jgi:hypothetical protein